MFRGLPASRQLFQKLFLNKNSYGLKRHYECRIPQPPPEIPKGRNFVPLAIGVGAAVSAGTALFISYNAEVRHFLQSQLGVGFDPPNETSPKQTMPASPSAETASSAENALDESAPEANNATPQQTINLEQVKEVQASCEALYMAALSACSLAAQAVGGLAADIASSSQELSGDGPHSAHSAHSDKVVLRLLVSKREVGAMLQDAQDASAKARSQMTELRKSMSDLYYSDNAVALETVEHIESLLSQEEKELGAVELHLQQAMESAATQEQLLRNRVASIAKSFKDELGFDFYESNNEEQRELYLAALALQLIQYRKQVELIKQAHEKKSSELLAMQGDEGNKRRLEAVLQAKEKELRQILQQENHHLLEQEKSNVYNEHQEKLKRERAAFERELCEQIKVASDRIRENFDDVIRMLNTVTPNLT
ncbi:hypothetical protein B566_EDAN007485, partial [Ephemera danica]